MQGQHNLAQVVLCPCAGMQGPASMAGKLTPWHSKKPCSPGHVPLVGYFIWKLQLTLGCLANTLQLFQHGPWSAYRLGLCEHRSQSLLCSSRRHTKVHSKQLQEGSFSKGHSTHLSRDTISGQTPEASASSSPCPRKLCCQVAQPQTASAVLPCLPPPLHT
jgi:hypothetical protein